LKRPDRIILAANNRLHLAPLAKSAGRLMILDELDDIIQRLDPVDILIRNPQAKVLFQVDDNFKQSK
jgi:SpoU rRNA methylase family enzyme